MIETYERACLKNQQKPKQCTDVLGGANVHARTIGQVSPQWRGHMYKIDIHKNLHGD